MFLVLYEAFFLLVLYPIVFVTVVVVDAIIVANFIFMLLLSPPIMVIFYILFLGIACLWLVITCRCLTMPWRAPGEGLVEYIFFAGGTFPDTPQDPQPMPIVEGVAAIANDSLCANLKELGGESLTLSCVNHVILVSFPYRRAQLRDLCREIVPWCNNIVI